MFRVSSLLGDAQLRVRRLCFAPVVCLVSACAGTAGGGQYQALSVDYRHSAAAPAEAAQHDAVPRGPLLERAAFVRAVLARNPSVESARQGWRAALENTGEQVMMKNGKQFPFIKAAVVVGGVLAMGHGMLSDKTAEGEERSGAARLVEVVVGTTAAAGAVLSGRV